jgi:predicted PurR-regulated permease PerM
VLILLSVIIAKEMYSLLGAFLGAITLYVVMRSSMVYLTTKRKWKRWVSAVSLMLSSILLLVVPLIWLTTYLFQILQPIIQDPSTINHIFAQINQYLLTHLNLDILNAANLDSLKAGVLSIAQKGIQGTMSGLGNLSIMYLILYFMLVSVLDIERWLKHTIPFKNKNVHTSIVEFRNLVYSNAIAIPLVGLVQGIVGLIGYWIFGVEAFILMGVFTAICSIVPMIGAAIVYLPLMVYEMAIGHTWQGVAIGIWGMVVIGSMDNIARLFIQKKLANVHPLITLFGAFIGINMFGFLGIIFGPLLLSMFFLLIKIYIDEFGKADADHLDATHPPTNPE